MAGRTRFAVKAILLTTVLATAGAGAYYATTGPDWRELLRVFDARPQNGGATLVADEAHELSPADLDAVASTWATKSDARQAGNDARSSSARSADVTLASAESPGDRPATSDRYGMYSQATSANLAADAERHAVELADSVSPEPAVSIDPITDRQQSPAASDSSPELARGQDPNDDEKAPDIAAVSDDTASASAAEPKPLELPAPANGLSNTAARAREAFRDEPTGKSAASPAARPSAGAGIGGRYATPAPTAGSPGRLAHRESAMENPFAAQPMQLPNTTTKSSASAANVPAAVRPLETNDDEPGNLSTGFRSQPQSEPANSVRSTIGQAPSDYRNNAMHSFDSAASAAISNPSQLTREHDGLGSSNALGTMEGTGKPGERALEGPQKPSLVIQKVAPLELQVGKPAKFVVQVRNVGSQAAEDVAVRDEVPQNTKLISTSPTADNDGSRLVWQLGKLSAGEERTVEMQVMPTAEGEIGSVATVTYSAQASVKARCTMPQLALRLTAPNEIMIGGEQRVKIELRNPGTGDATGVMLFENVPQNLRHAAGPALEFEIGTLKAGETRELELVLKAEKAGKVVNVLSARADGNLQVQQQVEFEVIAPALAVDVNGPERRYLERPATYEVSVANPGTATAHDVQLVTKLPKGMRFVRANNMGEYDAASHAVYWSLAELPEGERGTVELVAMPIETGPQTLEVEGRAQQGLSDHKQQQIVVEGLAAIMFEVRDLDDPIEVGGETGYEIRVVNQGTKAATNVKVAIKLPPGMKMISAEGESRHAVEGNSIVFEPLAQLAPKADTVCRVKAQGIQAGDQRVMVEVNTDDLGQPIRREESTRVFGDE